MTGNAPEQDVWKNVPSRLMYLAETLRIPIPKKLLKLIPTGKVLGSIISIGIKATAIELGINKNQLMNLFTEGKEQDETKASEQEFRMLIGQTAMETLEFGDKEIPFTEKMKLHKEIAEFIYEKRNQLIEFEEVSLGGKDINKEVQLPTFDTGFQPLDVLTGGIAQTLVVFMGRPGTGKTSLLLSLMGELRKTNACSSIWFFSLEMPLQMMKWRAKFLLSEVEFLEEDKFFCGQYSPTNILSMIEESPDPNRVIIYDSPDALGGGGDQRRFVLEELYRQLVQIKTNCKVVFTASQPRRADRILALDSFAESWAKAWYSDMVITITNQGRANNSEMSRLRLETVKHRFGVSGMAVDFDYNYATLGYTDTLSSNDASGWGDSNELRIAAGNPTTPDNESGW